MDAPALNRFSAGPATGFAPQSGDLVGEVTSPLARYWQIALRWRWLILGTIVASLLVGLAITLSMTPIYRATSTLEILREEAKIVDIKSVEPTTTGIDMEFYQTQYGLLKSRSLAERVVRTLGLARDDRFLALYGRAVERRSWFGRAVARTPAQLRVQRERSAISVLLLNLSISPVRASRLVEISYASPDAQLSQRVVNAWAENFIASNLERRFDASSYARRFLEGRLQDVRQKLEESERSLVNYATQQRIISIAGAAQPDGRAAEQSLVANDLNALNAALTTATASRVEAESRLLQARGRAGPEAIGNDVISGLRRQRAEASADYSKLAAQFQPDYPPLAAVRAQLGEIDRMIAREERRVGESIRTQFDEARDRESMLQGKVNTLKSGYLDMRRRSIQYNIFQREVDTNRTLYDGLLQRYKEIGIAGGVGTNNVSIVDRAVTPLKPSSPRPLLNLMFAGLAGIFLGLALAFVMDQIDETISSPEQIESKVGLPLLGTIPIWKDGDVAAALADRRSGISEAYFSVNTSLQFSTTHGVPRSLLVTSARPGEGKSTTSSTLARNLARLDKTVLLVDGDLRNPSLHRSLALANKRGLSDVLSGNAPLEGATQPTDLANLRVVTTGPLPPNPAELLSGSRLSEILHEASEHYDHVVIDGPPVLGLADAPLLGSHVENVIFVVQSHSARSGVVRLALKRLMAARAHVVGVVLTKFEPRRASVNYGEDYGYAYSYRYGRKDDA